MSEVVKGGEAKGRKRKRRERKAGGAGSARLAQDEPRRDDLQNGASPAGAGLADVRKPGASLAENRPGGYYADFMTAQERKDLSAAITNSLEDEIAGLKVLNRRMFALFSEAETIREAVAIHKAYAAAVSRILQLEKTLRSLQDQNDLANEAFSLALTEVMQEMKIHI